MRSLMLPVWVGILALSGFSAGFPVSASLAEDLTDGSPSSPPARFRTPTPSPVQPATAIGSLARHGSPEPHPLDPALKLAEQALANLRESVRDYTAVLVKRDRVDGKLTEHQFISAKIRSRRVENGRVVVPFSVYLKFLKPRGVEGREVIWVEGRDGGKLLAHEGGFKNFLTVKLDPLGKFAMAGQRYPIYDIGLESLVQKLLEKGERDRKRDECVVQFFRDAKVDDRNCTLIRVTHPQPRAYFDFHVAEIFFDEERLVPVRYASYKWPEQAGGEPVLEEEFTYQNLKLNVGLDDADFDPKNSEYRFP